MSELRKRDGLLILFLAIVVLAAGCGDSRFLPYYPTSGNLEGYIYVKSYNNSYASRAVMGIAARTVPDGYVPVENAQVSLAAKDFEPFGEVDPVTTDSDGKFTFTNVEVGTYTLTAAKTGMDDMQVEVTVVANVTTVANDTAGDDAMDMAPSQTGTLTVTAAADCQVSVPVQATVYVDNMETSYTTPAAVITDIGVGAHTILVRADGYITPSERNVTVADGSQYTVDFILTPEGGNSAPYAAITSPVSGTTVGQGTTVIFTGSAADCEDGSVTGTGLTWSSSIDSTLGTGATLTSSTLSVGTHTITLTAVDSGLLSDSAIITVIVTTAVNTAPTATIVMPVEGSSYSLGATINFIGTGIDSQDGALSGSSLVWSSSINGQIGTGTNFSYTSLTAGTHTITLTVTDSDDQTDTDTVTIAVSSTPAVNTAPVAAIATPVNGQSIVSGTIVFFSGGAADAEDGAITGTSLVWTSSRDGTIGTGTYFMKSSLSVGTHTITLTATDSHDATGADTVSITVTSP